MELEAGPGGEGAQDRRRRVRNRALIGPAATGPGGESGQVAAAFPPAGGLPAVRGELADARVHEVEDPDEVAGVHDRSVGEGDRAAAVAPELEAEDAGRADRADPVAASVEALPGGEDGVEDRRSSGPPRGGRTP
ncbi:MAG: hypothetical protein KatS3mg065_0015 [Chloroflexota bacterium]|nr:MAG: hypothetical protein KatS3mg065_0015 [Chloroflexota bacterium]